MPVLSVPFHYIGNGGAGPLSQANLTLVGFALFGTGTYGYGVGQAVIFSMNADGSGTTIWHTFTGANGDGSGSVSKLTLVGSTLFGTTENGGTYGDGTIFSINTDGTGYQVLYSFGASATDGQDPTAGLTIDGSTLLERRTKGAIPLQIRALAAAPSSRSGPTARDTRFSILSRIPSNSSMNRSRV